MEVPNENNVRLALNLAKLWPYCQMSNLNGQYGLSACISGARAREYVSGLVKEPPVGYPLERHSAGGHSRGNSTATSKSIM